MHVVRVVHSILLTCGQIVLFSFSKFNSHSPANGVEMSRRPTFEVSKTSVLPDDGGLSWQTSVLAAHATADICILWQLRPHGPSVRHEVQLVEQSRLIPGGKRAAMREGNKRSRGTCVCVFNRKEIFLF